MLRRVSLLLCIVAIMAISAGSAFAQANLVTNGTFDGGNTDGWTNTGAGINHAGDFGIPASPESGSGGNTFCGQITSWGGGGGSIQQTVALSGSGMLSLDLFCVANMNDGSQGRPGHVDVSWNGTQVIHYAPPSGSAMASDEAWLVYSIPVTGTGANTLLISWGASSATWTWTCVDDIKVVGGTPVGITGPTVTLSGEHSATIAWTTDVASDGAIGYGIGNTNTTASSSALTTSHSFTISGLTVDSLYNLQISSAASGYATGNKSSTFQTARIQTSLKNGGFEARTNPPPPGVATVDLTPWMKFNIDPTGDVNGANYDFDGAFTYTSTLVTPHSGFQYAGARCTQIRESRTGILQRVATVPGKPYAAQAWIMTVNSPDTNIYCVPLGAATDCGVRIGVDPTGSTDPTASTIQWDYADNQPGPKSPAWYNDVWAYTQSAPWTCGIGWAQNGWTLISSPTITATNTNATVFVQVLMKYTELHDSCLIDDVSFGDPSAVTTPGQAKTKQANWAVTLGGGSDPSTMMYVTYVDPTATFCYVEAGDRSSGIRVDIPNPNSVSVGDIVQVSGQTALDGAECAIHSVNGSNPYVQVNPVLRIGVDLDNTIKPLALSNGATGGAAFGLQPAVGGGTGVPPTGLLVTVSGKFVKSNAFNADLSRGPFWIDDGCQQNGGIDSSLSSVTGLKCYLPSQPTGQLNLLSTTDYLVVTGVVGVEQSGTSVIPVIYCRSNDDVQDLGQFSGPGQ